MNINNISTHTPANTPHKQHTDLQRHNTKLHTNKSTKDTYTCTYTHTHSHTYTPYIHTHTHAHTHTYTHTHTHSHTHTQYTPALAVVRVEHDLNTQREERLVENFVFQHGLRHTENGTSFKGTDNLKLRTSL